MEAYSKLTHNGRYTSEGKQMVFYVRCLIEKIPPGKDLKFNPDKNYPVLSVDPQGNKLLIPDDTNKLLWLPMGLFKFVKIT